MNSSTEVDPRLGHAPGDIMPLRDVMPQHDVVCLHSGGGAGEWFAHQLDALGARAWEPGIGVTFDVTGPPGQMDDWVEAASSALHESASGPAHILASGTAAYGAIMLAALHPQQVKSLILGDPLVDTSVEGFVATLRRVRAPSLVIAAAPDLDTDISIPQSIAGGISNGVFVIIDNTAVPAHQSRSHSFNEWSRSFMNIAEGLHTVTETQEEHSA